MIKNFRAKILEKIARLFKECGHPYTRDKSYIREIQKWREIVDWENTDNLPKNLCIGDVLPGVQEKWVLKVRDLVLRIKHITPENNQQQIDAIFSLYAMSGVVVRRFVDLLYVMLRQEYVHQFPTKFKYQCSLNGNEAFEKLRDDQTKNFRTSTAESIETYQQFQKVLFGYKLQKLCKQYILKKLEID
eukprot:TRINITY_DN77217_c0_g1_i2.p1 TRINITY_DN77217_c0_g1~~TRINITY_DN77217_c0_g1_i2.p1  ORF type:complete len:188 (-),score=9.09 TRINITY_DN77217_c0_g1_i2:178-741(-)